MALHGSHAILPPSIRTDGAKQRLFALSVAVLLSVLCQPKVEAQVVTGDQTSLRLVQVVFRHGNRTPQRPYINDPNAEETFYPFGWDELDLFGRQSSYELGRYLKNRYGEFVGDYNKATVSVLSTSIRRAKMSTQLVAAGLFPPSSDWKWGPQGGLGDYWQPVAFRYRPEEEDDLLYMKKVRCPVYDEEMRRVDNGPVMRTALESDPELVASFRKNAKLPPSVHLLAGIWQTMDIENSYNLTIPEWAKPFYPDRLLPFAILHFKMNAWTSTMQRLRGGPLLAHLIKEMEDKTRMSEQKIQLYSGHDDTVATLGMTMRVWGDFLPVFSSAIILELHSDTNGEYFVKTFFHNDTSKSPIELTVPGCEPACPLGMLRYILRDPISVDLRQQCSGFRDAAATAAAPHLLLFVFFVPLNLFRSL